MRAALFRSQIFNIEIKKFLVGKSNSQIEIIFVHSNPSRRDDLMISFPFGWYNIDCNESDIPKLLLKFNWSNQIIKLHFLSQYSIFASITNILFDQAISKHSWSRKECFSALINVATYTTCSLRMSQFSQWEFLITFSF